PPRAALEPRAPPTLWWHGTRQETLPGHPFSRSYGVKLPSSLTGDRSSTLREFPLPTSVGVRYGRRRPRPPASPHPKRCGPAHQQPARVPLAPSPPPPSRPPRGTPPPAPERRAAPRPPKEPGGWWHRPRPDLPGRSPLRSNRPCPFGRRMLAT